MALLEMNELSVSFEQYTKGLKKRVIDVVNNINLEVNENEIVAIFGTSGCGKSLLAHAILGLLPDNAIVSGTISYKGKELNKEMIEELRGNEFGFIPQAITSLNPLMKIKDQAFIDPKNKEEYELELRKGLKAFDLSEDVLELYPHELSGGMARRILVILSCLNHAPVMIADEPTPGMDDACLNEFVSYFKEYKKNGGTAVIISHDIKTMLKLADRIAIFHDGTIIEVIDRKDFTMDGSHVEHEFTKKLLQALPKTCFEEGLC